MGDKLHRIFKLLSLLQTGRVNADALSAMLNVHRRTVFRDIEDLRKIGFAINLDDKTQSYSVVGNPILPEAQFDLEEALALITLCHEIGNNNRVPFFQAAQRAALKLHNILPYKLQDDLKKVERSVHLRYPPTCPHHESQSVFEAIMESYQTEKAVRIRYHGPLEPEFETVLYPYHVVFFHRSWYVIGRSSLHKETRTFHIGRITGYELEETSYKIPRGFSLDDYFGNAWRMIREPGPDHEVVIRFSKLVARNVSEVAWHPTQQIQKNTDGSIDYHVTVSGLNEISWWILGYGREAEVLQPAKLREMIREHAKDTFDNHQ